MSSVISKSLLIGNHELFVGKLEDFQQNFGGLCKDRFGALVALERNCGSSDVFKRVPSFFGPEVGCKCNEAKCNVVFVAENTHAGEPIVINIGQAAGLDEAIFCRNLIIVESGATAAIEVRYKGNLCECGRVAEVYLGNKAELEMVEVFDGVKSLEPIKSNVVVRQEANSHLRSVVCQIGSRNVDSSLKVILAEEGAVAELFGAVYGSDVAKINNSTIVQHSAANTTSREHYKVVVADSALSSFNGCIYVAPGAMPIEAFQQNNNILLSDKARAMSQPQLQIYADDVKCSHGATVGQLNSDALFYMQQRGISEPMARRLLIEGFIGQIFAKISNKQLRDSLKEQIGRLK